MDLKKSRLDLQKNLKIKSEELNAMDEKVAELKKIKEELIKYAKNKNLEIAGLDAQLKEARESNSSEELEIARQVQLINESKFAAARLSREISDIKRSMSWKIFRVSEK